MLNVSIDLGVHGRDHAPQPPVEACLRVIDEPVLRLTSVDLGATADISSLSEVFDFARDYLGLLKAAVIAAGIVPPGIEGSGRNWPTCWPGWRDRAGGWKSSATSTIFLRVRAWRFRPICSHP